MLTTEERSTIAKKAAAKSVEVRTKKAARRRNRRASRDNQWILPQP
jgi:hypothetical protein